MLRSIKKIYQLFNIMKYLFGEKLIARIMITNKVHKEYHAKLKPKYVGTLCVPNNVREYLQLGGGINTKRNNHIQLKWHRSFIYYLNRTEIISMKKKYVMSNYFANCN